MTDAKKLHLETMRIWQRIQIKLEEAQRAIQRARSWTRAGDFNKASYENTLANKDYLEAIKMDQEAIDFFHQAINLEDKAWEIEQEQQQIQMSTQRKLDQLERQKRVLLGE